MGTHGTQGTHGVGVGKRLDGERFLFYGFPFVFKILFGIFISLFGFTALV